MIAIISCGKAKLRRCARARDLYIGPLFKAQYRYARLAGASKIYILSAKYGLVHESELLDPYDIKASGLSKEDRATLIAKVEVQLAKLQSGRILVLVSSNYERALASRAPDLTNPLRGMPLGKRMQFLARSNAHESDQSSRRLQRRTRLHHLPGLG